MNENWTWKAQGEANEYVVLDGGKWVAAIRLTLRDYFIAHAPAEPQAWFQPKMPTPRPQRPTIASLSPEDQRDWHGERMDYEPDKCSPELHAFAEARRSYEKNVNEWDREYSKQWCIQWPAAWADAMLRAREAA
ncbi:DNA topoisomerase [Ralstonia phage AhaGv]|nr:DNA topoisomerase [Ralstonia phage AhaGv]